jgi:hypothetical protein
MSNKNNAFNTIMETIRKSHVTFDLAFTTSKLLAYIVVISSAVLGYLLSSAEVVIVGFTIGAALSGVKSMLESKKGNNTVNMDPNIDNTSDGNDNDGNSNDQNNSDKNKREILL